MALNSICASCLRTIRRSHPQSSYRLLASRSAFSTTTHPFADAQQQQQRQRTPAATTPPPPASAPPPARDSTDNKDTFTNIAARLRSSNALRSTTEPLVAYGVTETLFLECSKQCNYTMPSALTSPPGEAPKNSSGEDVGEGTGWWFEPKVNGGLGLDTTFSSWSQVMFLHMFALTVRLREFPAEHVKTWHQNLLDHFFYAAEDRMAVCHGMSSRGLRNRYLKDLFLQWRGALVSYDEGLIKGDAVLAAAVWRNVFKGRAETDVADVALVTAHLRLQLKKLDESSNEEVADARVMFDSPVNALVAIGEESPWMKRKFDDVKVETPAQTA